MSESCLTHTNKEAPQNVFQVRVHTHIYRYSLDRSYFSLFPKSISRNWAKQAVLIIWRMTILKYFCDSERLVYFLIGVSQLPVLDPVHEWLAMPIL